jgi:hypothetical protein
VLLDPTERPLALAAYRVMPPRSAEANCTGSAPGSRRRQACRRGAGVEATALGNLLVQARTLGAASGDLAALRARIRATSTRLHRYEPRALWGRSLVADVRPPGKRVMALTSC